MRKIAISDIHGCYLTFQKLLLEVIQFSKDDELFLLGDYVDRGPSSKQVLDFIFDLQQKEYKVHCLLGNHEEAMLDCTQGKGSKMNWIRHGGIMTMNSFDVSSPQEIPEKYVNFIKNLDYYFEIDNYILVHSGLNFSSPTPLQDKSGMLWSRGWETYTDKTWLGQRTVIYGHTPVKRQEIEKNLSLIQERQILNIDAGCYGKGYPGHGVLCAFDMTNHELFFQENLDDMSLWEFQNSQQG